MKTFYVLYYLNLKNLINFLVIYEAYEISFVIM